MVSTFLHKILHAKTFWVEQIAFMMTYRKSIIDYCTLSANRAYFASFTECYAVAILLEVLGIKT